MRVNPLLLAPLILNLGCEDFEGIGNPDLYGRVTIDGRPAAGITVTASTSGNRFTAQTTSSGTYEFTHMPRGSVTLTIAGYPANVLFGNYVQEAELDGVSRFERNFAGFGPVEVRGYLLWAYTVPMGVPIQPSPSLAVPGVAVRIEGSPFPVAGTVTTEAGFYRLTGAPGLGEFSVVFGALPAGLGYDQNNDHLVRASSRRGRVDTTYAVYEPSAQLRVFIMVDGRERSGNADVHLATPLPITSRSNYFNNLPVLPIDVRISGFPAAIQFSTTVRTVQLGVKDTVVFTGYSPGANRPPVATITAPQNGASFALGTPITFQGTGVDPEDGVLTGNALRWTAFGSGTFLGTFGTGESFTNSSLPLGPHRINLVATDSDTVTTSTFIDITIVPVTTGRITGIVTVYDHPRQGVRLTLSTTPSRSAITDAQGVYSFDNVPAGTYVLTLEPPQYTAFPSTTQSVTVKAGATETINFAGHIGSPNRAGTPALSALAR